MIGRLLRAETTTIDGSAAHWLTDGWGTIKTRAGINVTEDEALTLSGIFRAIDLVASHFAMLPFPVYRRLEGDDRERDNTHPLSPLLNVSPHPEMTAFDWRRTMQAHVMLWGNGRSIISRDGAGNVERLDIVNPSRVRTVRDRADNSLWHEVRNNDGTIDFIPDRQMLHIKNLSTDGVNGLNVVRQLARENIGKSLAIERYAEAFFGNGTVVGTVLTLPEGVRLDEEAEKKLLNSWNEAHKGSDSYHKTTILKGGMKAELLRAQNDDAQMVEMLAYSVKDISRWTGVPPHMLSEMSESTYNNISEQALGYVKWTLSVHLEAWKQAVNQKLLPLSQRTTHFAECVTEGILQGDAKARSEFYNVMWNLGAITINEIRRRENLNGIGPAGDQHFVMLNMTTAERMLEGRVEPPEPAGQENRQQRQSGAEAIKKASARVFADAASRLVRKEVQATKRAAKRLNGNPAALNDWCDRFFGELRGGMFDMFASPAESLAELVAFDLGHEGLSTAILAAVESSLRAYVIQHVAEARSVIESAITEKSVDKACNDMEILWPPKIAQRLTDETAAAVWGALKCESNHENN